MKVRRGEEYSLTPARSSRRTRWGTSNSVVSMRFESCSGPGDTWRHLGGKHYFARRAAMKSAMSPGATRIAFSTRTWRSSPRAQSWYTVSRHTCRKTATSRTVNRRSEADTARSVESCSTNAAKFFVSAVIPCEQLGWLDWLIRLIPKSSSTVVSGCEELKSAGDGSWLHFESEGRGFDSLRAR